MKTLNDTDGEKLKYLEINLPQYLFFRHKAQIDRPGIETDPPRIKDEE
jgi:hypothetical protein